MIPEVRAQDITVPPGITVDTGDDWLDLAFVIILIVLVGAVTIGIAYARSKFNATRQDHTDRP